jgi:hypothetical protein
MSEVTCSIVDAACMPCTHSQASFCCSMAPVCRRHGPLVQYSGQLYPVRMVLI